MFFHQPNNQNQLFFQNLNLPLITIGRAQFSHRIQFQENFSLIDTDTLGKLLKNQLHFSAILNEQKQQVWIKIFRLIKNFKIDKLTIKNSWNQKLFMSICHINFEKLRYLDIFEMEIQNFEFISFMEMPNIKTINCIYNKTRSFDSLRKTKFTKNRIKFYCHISEKRVSLQGFKNVSRTGIVFDNLRLEKYSTDAIINNDLSIFAKLQMDNEPTKIVVKYPQDLSLIYRIRQKKVENALIQKNIVIETNLREYHNGYTDNMTMQQAENSMNLVNLLRGLQI